MGLLQEFTYSSSIGLNGLRMPWAIDRSFIICEQKNADCGRGQKASSDFKLVIIVMW